MLKALTMYLPLSPRSSGATLFALVLALCAPPAAARGVYQEPNAFIAAVFAPPVDAKVIWLNEARQKEIGKILGHPYPSLRLRYWQTDESSAWILEEIGKEKPITLGVVIKQGRIERLSVLIFRESRGDEIRHPFFTQQFSQLALTGDLQLNGHIDGISGATLSVRAAQKIARLALYLHNQVAGSP